MLNSAEHEILNTRKYNNIKQFSLFRVQIRLECYFSFINVKMPTIVGILTFMSRKNFMLSCVEHEIFYNLGACNMSSLELHVYRYCLLVVIKSLLKSVEV